MDAVIEQKKKNWNANMPLVKRNKNSSLWVLEKSEIEDIIMYPNEKHYKFCPHIWLGYIKIY